MKRWGKSGGAPRGMGDEEKKVEKEVEEVEEEQVVKNENDLIVEQTALA